MEKKIVLWAYTHIDKIFEHMATNGKSGDNRRHGAVKSRSRVKKH